MLEERDQFDKELDDALATYAYVPESEGLERRVLARATSVKARRGLVLPWTAAVCTVAVACWLFWLQPLNLRVQKQPVENAKLASSKIQASKALTLPPHHLAVVSTKTAKPRRILKRLAEPKLPQFPTPFPITNEEASLLRLMRGDQESIARELKGFGGPVEPIRITAIEIKPLE